MVRSTIARLAGPVGETVAALRGGGRGWVLVTVALGWMLVLGTRLVVPALLPRITVEFAIDNTTAGIAVTLLWLTYAGMQFPAGVLTDRRGERDVLLAGIGIGAAGVLAFAIAPVFAFFLAACALFGLGTGLYGPPRVTVLSNSFPDNDGTAIGLTFAAGSVGAAALPFLAEVVSARLGWRAGFGLAVPLFALASIGLWRAVPARDSTATSAVSRSAGHAATRLGAAMRRRSVLLIGVATTILVFGFQGFTAFLPTYLVVEKGLSRSAAAGLFGLFFGVGALVNPLAGNAADRFGDRGVLVTLATLNAALLVALAVLDDPVALAAVVVLLGTRAGLGPINNAYLVAALPDDVQGSGYGLVRSVYMGVGSLGSVAVGAFADAGVFDEAFLLLAALAAVAAATYVLLPARSALAARRTRPTDG